MASTINMIPYGVQPGYDYNERLPVYGEKQISQVFKSKEKNLVAIATSIRNPNLNNKREISLDLYDENHNLIRTSVLNGKNIEDGDFVKFIFPVITNSSNKKYTFTLSSPSAGPEETIEIFTIDPTEYILNYSYENEDYSGGIPMVTFHKPDSKWEIVKRVYSNLFSRLLH